MPFAVTVTSPELVTMNDARFKFPPDKLKLDIPTFEPAMVSVPDEIVKASMVPPEAKVNVAV